MFQTEIRGVCSTKLSFTMASAIISDFARKEELLFTNGVQMVGPEIHNPKHSFLCYDIFFKLVFMVWWLVNRTKDFPEQSPISRNLLFIISNVVFLVSGVL